MLIDSHCHIPLVLQQVPGTELAGLLDAAREAGVGGLLCVAVDLEGVPALLGLSRHYSHIYASVGVHPNAHPIHEPDMDTLLAYARDPRVIAIGETGLDYYRSQGDLSWQHERFRRHIRVARSANKPLIIHSRDSREDIIKILVEEKANEVGGIMHCFVDDYDTALKALHLNFLISFSGIVTFKNAAALQDVARKLPLEKLLVETDAPYLAPVPFRGKSNQPAFVRYVAEFLAALKGVTFERIAEQTTKNFYNLFPSTRAERSFTGETL
jgi:TatD DNase family protein